MSAKSARITLFLCVSALCFITGASTGCQTAPSQRVVQVQTLKGVGHSAEAAVALAANLYSAGRISVAQLRQVADFYDTKFQPAFRVAVAAVNANLESVASPDLTALAAQLSALVASFASP